MVTTGVWLPDGWFDLHAALAAVGDRAWSASDFWEPEMANFQGRLWLLEAMIERCEGLAERGNATGRWEELQEHLRDVLAESQQRGGTVADDPDGYLAAARQAVATLACAVFAEVAASRDPESMIDLGDDGYLCVWSEEPGRGDGPGIATFVDDLCTDVAFHDGMVAGGAVPPARWELSIRDV